MQDRDGKPIEIDSLVVVDRLEGPTTGRVSKIHRVEIEIYVRQGGTESWIYAPIVDGRAQVSVAEETKESAREKQARYVVRRSIVHAADILHEGKTDPEHAVTCWAIAVGAAQSCWGHDHDNWPLDMWAKLETGRTLVQPYTQTKLTY